MSNYNEYSKYVDQINDSPDFQVQLYKVYMQSLIFALLLFIVAHLVIYLLFLKKYKGALIYLKVYCFLSSIGCLLLTFLGTPYLFVLTLSYAAGFYILRQIQSEKVAEITVKGD